MVIGGGVPKRSTCVRIMKSHDLKLISVMTVSCVCAMPRQAMERRKRDQAGMSGGKVLAGGPQESRVNMAKRTAGRLPVVASEPNVQEAAVDSHSDGSGIEGGGADQETGAGVDTVHVHSPSPGNSHHSEQVRTGSIVPSIEGQAVIQGAF